MSTPPDDLPTDQPLTTPAEPASTEPPPPEPTPAPADDVDALEPPEPELSELDPPEDEQPPFPSADDEPAWLDPPEPNDPGLSQLATGADGIALPPPPPDAEPERSDADERGITSAAQSTSLNRRLAPFNPDAERSILGGILLTNESAMDVLEVVKAPDFWEERHRIIFDAVADMAMKNLAIDVITLGDKLRARGMLDAVGGPAYISSLDAFVPATANLRRYARVVNDLARRRRFLEDLHRALREGYARKQETDEYIDDVKSRLMAHNGDPRGGDLEPTKDIIPRVFGQIEDRYDQKVEITGLDTGFHMLNTILCGLQNGDLIIVAGRPSMGKTSVVMNMAAHIAIQLAKPVAVFSMEMSKDALGLRLFSSEARVDSHRLRSGKLLDSDWPKLARAADRLHKAPLYIDDTRNLSVNDIRARLRRMQFKRNDLSLCIVDYLQLMKGAGERREGREQEVSDISKGLKSLAGEFKIPVIALSQLNRAVENRQDKRPGLADLRESGSLEQDADVVGFVYRDEVYDKESKDKGIAEFIIGKQRNGDTGTVRLAFQREFTLFANLEEGFGGAQ